MKSQFITPALALLALAGAARADIVGAASAPAGYYTPATLAGAVGCATPLSPSGCTDASAAFNAAVTKAVANGYTLTVDQPLYGTGHFLLQSGLTLVCVNGGEFVQGFTPTGSDGVVTQAAFGTPLTGVVIKGCNIQGDVNHVLSGNMWALNLSLSAMVNPSVSAYGGSAGAGRAYQMILNQTTIINPTAYNPYNSVGIGGFRAQGCTDSEVDGGFIASGDDTWQWVPSITGTTGGNLDILRCNFVGVAGYSLQARLFAAQLITSQTAGYQVLTAWPSNTAGTGSGYVVGDVLTGAGGTCSIQPTWAVTAVNAGAITQVQERKGGACTVQPTNPVSPTGGSGTGASLTVAWARGDVMTSCILDSGISVAGGYASTNRGIIAQLANSNGANCPGRPAIDNLTIRGVHIDATPSWSYGEQIILGGLDDAHPVGTIHLDDVSVQSPYMTCLTVQTVQWLDARGLWCGRPHAALLGTVSATGWAGATTLTVPTALCDLVRNGDSLGITLDNTIANGSRAGRLQQVTASGACSGTTLTLSAALLGNVTSGIGQVYDYSQQSQPLIAAASGNPVCVQWVANMTAGDSVVLVYDDGTTDATTIASINSTTNCVTLTSAPSKNASIGNLLSDQTISGATSNVLVKGALGGVLTAPVIYGGGASDILLGPSTVLANYSTNFSVAGGTLNDIGPGNYGVQMNQCDRCRVSGSSFLRTAGSATSNAVGYSVALAPWSGHLAAAINNSQTTIAVEEFANFPQSRSFYAYIGSEIVQVIGGFGTPTWTIVRAQLGSTAASAAVGAAITMAQTGTTYSPSDNLDLGDLNEQFCASMFGYVGGQGNAPSNLQGCDSTSLNVATASAITYSDFAPQMRLTGSTNIGSLTLPVAPPFIAAPITLYYSAGSGSITITDGGSTNIANVPPGVQTLTFKRAQFYRFDPVTQTLRAQGAQTP